MTLDLDRLDVAVDRAIANQACVAVAPSEMREALRLARVGREAETVTPRAPHQDDGA